MYLNMFYSKIPDPWGSALIREYPFVNLDTLGRRISFLKEKLSEWCHQAYLMKKAKTIKSDNVLCYRGNDLITVIGDLKKSYKPNKKKFNKRFYNRYGRKIYFIKRKPKYFRKKCNTNRRTIYRKKTLKKQKNSGIMLVIKLGIMLTNVLINLIKRILK